MSPPGADIPLPATGSWVDIHYRRIGRSEAVYRQLVLKSGVDGIVTFQPRTPIDRPLEADGATILEPGSPVVWFTFPGTWHDIGLFHRANGAFTGLYANVLTPVEFIDKRTWATTDLCLDLWMPRRGSVQLLDKAELDEAEGAELIERGLAGRARAEATALLDGCGAGNWPPSETGEWSLARALDLCRAKTQGELGFG